MTIFRAVNLAQHARNSWAPAELTQARLGLADVRTTNSAGGGAAEEAMARRLARPVAVMVSRRPGGWVAEVAALGVERGARCLVTLDRRVRELLGTDAVDYRFHTGDAELDRLVIHIRAARAAAPRYDERAHQLTEQALRLPNGGTVRDLGLLLGLSHGRIHQLVRRQAPRPSTVEDQP